MLFLVFATAAMAAAIRSCKHSPLRSIMYFDSYHLTTPPVKNMTAGINYVNMAFAHSNLFNTGEAYKPFKPIPEVRALFDNGTKVCLSVGGWGASEGFAQACATNASRSAYAKNVAATIKALGFDCVDIDWEYPGGNGEDYRRVPNDKKMGEIEAFPLLLADIRAAIGNATELSIAVPGKKKDMIAFTAEQMPKIVASVDFVNVMTYDLMNRRDNVTNHHSSVAGSRDAVDEYMKRGLPADKINLGFAFYAKWFTTSGSCVGPLGCPVVELEAADGTDTGKSGAVTFSAHDEAPLELRQELQQALSHGRADEAQGGQWFYNNATRRFWTWDSPDFIHKKLEAVVRPKGLGGVFAWSLGEDGPDWGHTLALSSGVAAV